MNIGTLHTGHENCFSNEDVGNLVKTDGTDENVPT